SERSTATTDETDARAAITSPARRPSPQPRSSTDAGAAGRISTSTPSPAMRPGKPPTRARYSSTFSRDSQVADRSPTARLLFDERGELRRRNPAVRLAHELRDDLPIGLRVEHHGDPALAAHIGRTEESLRISRDQRLLRLDRRGQPHRAVGRP